MFLKRIELYGFKSFADKTALDFHSGISAIVGPNGSGKSNISDAVRWVLGEMSAKSLRGSNMQDIIFLGTEKRKPLNFAQVTLVLDNSDNTFNIEFDEVTVTRRVFRSGESTYLINKSQCRLKDIIELFMDTGLGREGYSIIGQGRVDKILSTKAEDRRSIFEEAAGISKYKHRKEDAEKKLKSVEENLERINDIVYELEKQLAPLEAQASKAKEYFILYDEYKSLDVSIAYLFIENSRKNLAETEKFYEDMLAERSELEENEFKLEEELTELYNSMRVQDEKNDEANELLRNNRNDKMSAENTVNLLKNDIQNNIGIAERIERDKEKARKKIEESQKKAADIEKQIDVLLEYERTVNEKIAGLEQNAAEYNNSMKEKRNVIEGMKGDIITLMNESSSARANISGIESLRKNFLERREAVEAEISGFNDSIESKKADAENNIRLIAEKEQKISDMKQRLERFEKRYSDSRNAMDEITAELNRMNIEYNSKASKKRILEDMENSYEGYSRSVKAVLTAEELKECSIYGTVSSIIQTDSKFITAIETALGGGMQNIVVETEEDAKTAIAYLKRSKSGRATFLPVSSVRAMGSALPDLREFPGYIGIAASLVKCDMKYREIIKNLLGRIAVTDNIDTAIAISRKHGYKFRIVTLEGDVINAGGSFSGGTAAKSSGFLSRSNDIKTLKEELLSLQKNIGQLNEKKSKIADDIGNLKDQTQTYGSMVREYEDELLRLTSAAEHLKESIESSAKSQKALHSELDELNIQLEDANERIGILINEATSKENNIKNIQERVNFLEEEFQALEKERENLNTASTNELMELNSTQKDIEAYRKNISDISDEINSYRESLRHYDDETGSILKKRAESEEEIQRLEVKINEYSEEYEKIRLSISEISQQKKYITDKLQEIQNSNKDLTEQLMLLSEQLTKLESRREKLVGEQDRVISRLWDQYELTLTEAKELAKPIDDEADAKKNSDMLKSKMKALGNLNLNAVDEYTAVKERYEFLSSQKSDLEDSKENLENMIKEIYALMSDCFAKQFKAVNESFSEVFSELFGGGLGRLYLSDPSDVLESGIEIEAQLPGKGLKNITLYSGGERSLIAIALLFAILNVKPTPFCILDEIDAALDDVNVSRFATYLKNYAAVQFIIITHRRGTMEAADVLYGVTMEEKGISKLLSLMIDDVDEKMVN